MKSDARTDDAPNLTKLVITPEMLKLIAELDEFKGAWRAVGRLAPERLAGLRQVATVESVGSSTRIEGAKLSDRQVELLLQNLESTSLATRDEQEVAGYAAVMETVFSSFPAISLSENHILQLHRDLLQFSASDARHRGAWKTLPNHVEASGPDTSGLRIVFRTASPFETPRLMAELVRWTKAASAKGELHPLLVIAIFVVVFLAIHPFQDGNGRLSRILTTLLLLQAGYAHVPYGSLESVIEQTRESYYLALRQTQSTLGSATPDWQPWIAYFLHALKTQKRNLERKLERERLILAELPALSATILEATRGRGRITVAEAAKLTGASRNTVKDHLKALTEAGHLVRHGAGRGSWYALA